MSAGPPLPADLWDSLPPEARALILALRAEVAELRAKVREQLGADLVCGCAKTAAVRQDRLRLEPALWTFTRREGIEPTNNAVERGFRHAAQWRRTSHGTESAAGSRFVEHILTVVATCRQQRREVLAYLTAGCQAYHHGEPLRPCYRPGLALDEQVPHAILRQ